MKDVRILGTGAYLPSRIVTNAEISPRLDSSPEWIFSHSGIDSRHVAASDESAASMGAQAAQEALAQAHVAPKEIGLIVLATTTPDYGSYPSTACLIQARLGCVNAAAFDLSAACSGFVYGLEMARGWLLCHPTSRVLVIGSELLSRQLDWADRSYAMLFGDGAGAVVLGVEDHDVPPRPSASVLGSDGRGAQVIFREAGGRHALCSDPVHETVDEMPVPYLKMDGHAVFAFAVRKLDEVTRELCAQAAVSLDSLDVIFAHQANVRILESVARRMKLPMSKFFLHLRTEGNTSSASIPIGLARAVREGSLMPGQRIVMVGFGSGLTWAGMLCEWPYLPT